ncbi:unnamed protein product [Caenorhabditis angaria]|uniref:Uncharacterized protein n=1 Tax=Caenorhabditis angaria TaxID=860376 RepID=A0A9P1ITT2_9PELO|nr:unnamed protein product [Caenorhabditis angaria]
MISENTTILELENVERCCYEINCSRLASKIFEISLIFQICQFNRGQKSSTAFHSTKNCIYQFTISIG